MLIIWYSKKITEALYLLTKSGKLLNKKVKRGKQKHSNWHTLTPLFKLTYFYICIQYIICIYVCQFNLGCSSCHLMSFTNLPYFRFEGNVISRNWGNHNDQHNYQPLPSYTHTVTYISAYAHSLKSLICSTTLRPLPVSCLGLVFVDRW